MWLALNTMDKGGSVWADLGGKQDRTLGESNLWETVVREAWEEGGLNFSGRLLSADDRVVITSSYCVFFLEASDAPRRTGDPRILEHKFFTAMPDSTLLHPRLRYGGTTMMQSLHACFSATTTATAKRKQVTEPAMPPAKQQKAPPTAVPVSGGAPEPLEEGPADWEEAMADAVGWD